MNGPITVTLLETTKNEAKFIIRDLVIGKKSRHFLSSNKSPGYPSRHKKSSWFELMHFFSAVNNGENSILIHVKKNPTKKNFKFRFNIRLYLVVDFKIWHTTCHFKSSALNRVFKCDFKKFLTGYLDLE